MNIKDIIASSIADLILSKARLRTHLVDKIKRKYFDLLNINLYLERGIIIPIAYEDSLASFKEIFVDRCYSWFQPEKPYRKWLDIGCNNGYFTLNLVYDQLERFEKTDINAFLIDGDYRSKLSIDKMTVGFPKDVRTKFVHAAVGPKQDKVNFLNLSAMLARVQNDEDDVADQTLIDSVPVISEEQIMHELSPPYDLVKVDIEGAEIDFLDNYTNLLEETDKLIIEWHSWNFRDCSLDDFEERLREIGFAPKQMGYKSFITGEKPVSCADYFCTRES